MGANIKLDDLAALIKHKANLRVTCKCGKQHIFDASRLNRYALCRGWNTQLAALGYYLRCDRCHRRGPSLRAVSEPPTPADTFPRSEREWSALVKRLRG